MKPQIFNILKNEIVTAHIAKCLAWIPAVIDSIIFVPLIM